MIRALPYVLAALMAGGGVWWVMDLRASNTELTATLKDRDRIIASKDRSIDVLTTRERAMREAEALARLQAQQIADNADDLRRQLVQHLEGDDCDPTDPACAIDFINGILRDARPPGTGD